MNLKHKVIKDFQYLTPDKKIFTLKSGTIIEEYVFKIKNEYVTIDKDVIDNNPDFFEIVEWKAELLTYLKTNKIPQPALLSKKIIPFIMEIISSIEQPQIKNDSFSEERERLRDKEKDYDIRIERLERKEKEYLEDLKSLKYKEDSYRSDMIKLSNRELELQENLRIVNEKQRKYDIQQLESINSATIDDKYKELEEKIKQNFQEISERESKLKELMSNFQEEYQKMEDIKLKIKDYNTYLDIKFSEIHNWRETVFNNWNYDLYPIPNFPTIEKIDFL